MKTKFTTTIQNEIIKEMKKEAVDLGISVGDLIEELFKAFKDQKK